MYCRCFLVVVWIVACLICQFFFLPLACAVGNEAEESFQEFNRKWMDGLYTREEKNKKNLTCKKVKDYYCAEYTGYSRTYSSTIKKIDSKETPYIGMLNYHEKKFESRADTFEKALSGPFNPVYEYPVTEIFSFTNGEWTY